MKRKTNCIHIIGLGGVFFGVKFIYMTNKMEINSPLLKYEFTYCPECGTKLDWKKLKGK